MTGSELRHLAVIAAAASDRAADAPDLLVASCEKAALIAAAAFAAIPGLHALSWVAPGVDRLLARADAARADAARAEGRRRIAEAAVGVGAELRVCGRSAGLTSPPPTAPAAGRTLLWYCDYGGRDEIVRAATRFFTAHPDRPLVDGELDDWLDTAGIPDPDLLLFAGGALEPQDALLWQGSYAEIWHTAVEWPQLAEADLRRAVDAYLKRRRRFGR